MTETIEVTAPNGIFQSEQSIKFPIQSSIQYIWNLKRRLILCEIKNGAQNTEKLLVLFAVHVCTYGSRNMYIVNYEDCFNPLKHTLHKETERPRGNRNLSIT